MILIDAYNLIHYHYDEVNINNIKKIVSYVSFFANNENLDFELVFDGTFFRHYFNSSYGRLSLVFFSGSADDYIINKINRSPVNFYKIVSADYEIRKVAFEKNKNGLIHPKDFFYEIRDYFNEKNNKIKKNFKKSKLIKITNESNSEIDDLMKLYTTSIPDKD